MMEPSSVAELRRVDGARLDAWLARLIGALLIGILVAAPVLFGALRDQDFFWIQMLGVLAGTLWLVRIWLRPQPIFLPPIIWPLVVFCIYGVVRYYTSDLEYVARKEVVRVLFYMMFFVLALNHFRDAKMADVAVAVLLALGMALSVWALRQHLADTKFIWHLVRPAYTHRGSGTFIYPNHFAAFAAMLLALGVGYVFLGTWSRWTRLFVGYCVAWLVTGLYVSLSRAGWIAAVGSWLVLLPILLRNRRQQIVAFMVFAMLLVAGLLWELGTRQISNRLKGVMTPDPATGFHSRQALWTGAYQMWRDHFAWGGGPGHFDERFREYRTKFFQFSAGNAHCDYLNVLADWGLVGGGLLLVALGFYLWPVTRHWLKTLLDPTELNAATTNCFALTCGGFAATVALLAHSAVDYQWYAPGVMLLFIAVVAMLLANLLKGRYTVSARIPLSLALVAMLVLQFVQGAQGVREQYWINKANRTESFHERIASLEKAFKADPFNFRTAYWIGESYRTWSFEGAEGYHELAEKAMAWFDRSARLNRFDPYPHMRKAMCLDWLKRHDEAEAAIQKALALDPEHYYVLGVAGWHYYQLEDVAKAFQYLKASLERNHIANPFREYFVLAYNRLHGVSR